MHDQVSVTSARAKLAQLYTGNPNPDPDRVGVARATLTTAKLDREMRIASDVKLNDVQVAHLVGLLLSQAEVPGPRAEDIRARVRAAVVAAQGGMQ